MAVPVCSKPLRVGSRIRSLTVFELVKDTTNYRLNKKGSPSTHSCGSDYGTQKEIGKVEVVAFENI